MFGRFVSAYICIAWRALGVTEHDAQLEGDVNMTCCSARAITSMVQIQVSGIVHSYTHIWRNILDENISSERQPARRKIRPMHNSDRDELCKGHESVFP